MQEYFRLGEFHIFRAPLFVHWSALASMGLILVVYWKDPIIAVIALLSFLSVILIHEIGHAAVASKMGYRVFKIKVSLFHGVCECQDPNHELDRANYDRNFICGLDLVWDLIINWLAPFENALK